MRGAVPEGVRRVGVLVAVFAALTVCFISKVYDFDLWFHLVTGREIVRTGALPTAEFYVYPVLGEPARFHEWGFALLTYATHQAFGWWGLALLNAGAGAGAVTLLIAAVRRRGVSMTAAVLLAAPLVFVMADRVRYRPELFLYLAFGAVVYVLERAGTDRRWLLVIPLLTLAVSLFHPTALLLLAIAGARGVDLLVVAQREGRLRGSLIWVGGALALAVLSIALAPYGLDQLTRPFSMAAHGLPQRLRELLPTLETTFAPVAVALGVVALASLAVGPRRWSDLLLVATFGWAGLRYVRGLPLFGLAVYPLAAVALDRAIGRIRSRTARVAIPATAIAATALALVASPFWGAGSMPGQFPELTADFIETHRPPGRIVNQLHTGGFMAWRLFPAYQVSIDGHFWGVNPAFEFTDSALAGAPGWRDALRARDVTMIATPGSFFSGDLVPLVADLAGDPTWTLVVVEPAGMLFLRSDVARNVGAESLPKDLVWRQVLAETDRAIATGSAGSKVHQARGIALFCLRSFADAAAEFARYVATAPGDLEAADLAALLQRRTGGDASATAQVEALWAAGQARSASGSSPPAP